MEVKEDEVLTLGQAAERLGVRRDTLAQQAKKGVLHATLAGSVYLVTATEVERYRREVRGKRGFAAASHPLHGKQGPGHRRKKGE
jgi:excisionase family DNA binding protein